MGKRNQGLEIGRCTGSYPRWRSRDRLIYRERGHRRQRRRCQLCLSGSSVLWTPSSKHRLFRPSNGKLLEHTCGRAANGWTLCAEGVEACNTRKGGLAKPQSWYRSRSEACPGQKKHERQHFGSRDCQNGEISRARRDLLDPTM